MQFVVSALCIEVAVGILGSVVFISAFRKLRLPIISPILLPIFIAPITVAMLWKQMFLYEGGLINKVFSLFGFRPVAWLTFSPLFAGSDSLQQSLNMTPAFLFLLLRSGSGRHFLWLCLLWRAL